MKNQKAKSLFLATCLVLLLSAIATTAAPTFTGRWVGHYTNVTGESGSDELALYEDPSGNLSGNWSGMAVRGQRLNADTFEIKASNQRRHYRGTGNLSGNTLTINYTATRLDSSGSYDGRSIFSPAP